MTDRECIEFLRWCLPELHMRWAGYRKVRRQVCKRISRRIAELELLDPRAYRAYLGKHPDEWEILGSLCRVTISRFYRDRGVFDKLSSSVIPEIAENARARGENVVTFWSAGCASGEEAYTLYTLWKLRITASNADAPELRIIATDSDRQLLERARRGLYRASSLKDMPDEMIKAAFEKTEDGYRMRTAFKEGITLREQDIRTQRPEESFHLILCRNLVFTYFEESLQRELLIETTKRMVPGGFLVIGIHETLPRHDEITIKLRHDPCIYQKTIP